MTRSSCASEDGQADFSPNHHKRGHRLIELEGSVHTSSTCAISFNDHNDRYHGLYCPNTFVCCVPPSCHLHVCGDTAGLLLVDSHTEHTFRRRLAGSSTTLSMDIPAEAWGLHEGHLASHLHIARCGCCAHGSFYAGAVDSKRGSGSIQHNHPSCVIVCSRDHLCQHPPRQSCHYSVGATHHIPCTVGLRMGLHVKS